MNEKQKGQEGFSLLEVVITLAILVTIIFSISNLLRNTIDVKLSLSQKNRVTQRMNRAMQQITSDLSHAFILSSTQDINRTEGRKRTLFRIKKNVGSGDTLEMTYMAHKALKANSKESDYSYVVYELKESEKFPHRKNLYRGELKRIPSSEYRFKEKPEMQLFVPNVKNMTLDAWRGDQWKKDGWDSHGRGTENLLPHMVRVSLEFWEEDPIEGIEYSQYDEESLISMSTMVGLPYSVDFKELKTRTSGVNFSKLE